MGYNVIWIDDEWDTRGKEFILLCEKKHEIHITPFKIRKEGMDLLLKDERPWDAVILDAKAYNETENETANLKGLYEAIKQIEGLKMKKCIPYFVLTRQPDLLDNETFKEMIGEYYKKGEPEKDEEGNIRVKGQAHLIEDLKAKVDESSRHRVKELYKDTVDILNQINPKACENILDVMEVVHFPAANPKYNYDESFNSLRKILESIFKKANQFQIIPDDCIDKKEDVVNISQCVHYLSGLNADVIGIRYGGNGERLVPLHIKDLLFPVQHLTSYLSHEYAQKYVANPKCLLFSLALQIGEIALWLDNYIKCNSDIDENRKKCKTIGIIEVIEGNLTHCIIRSKRKGYEMKFCLLRSYAERKKLIGKKVVVVDYLNNTDKETKEKYPYFARIEPLD